MSDSIIEAAARDSLRFSWYGAQAVCGGTVPYPARRFGSYRRRREIDSMQMTVRNVTALLASLLIVVTARATVMVAS